MAAAAVAGSVLAWLFEDPSSISVVECPLDVTAP
jgi:hypothetical protein